MFVTCTLHHTDAGTFVSNVHCCWTCPTRDKQILLPLHPHGGEIEGQVADIRPRRSPIPSGGLEMKLNLIFTAEGPIMHMMRQFLRDLYLWDYTGDWGAGVQQDYKF